MLTGGGYASVSSYGSSSGHNEGFTIQNCTISNYYSYGIRMYYTARLNIHNNDVQLGRNSSSCYALYIYNYHSSAQPDGPHFITGNKLVSGYYPYMYALDNGTGSPGVFSNNMVLSGNTTYSLYFNGSTSSNYMNRNWQIYNNTIVGTSASTYGARFYYVDNYDIRNNIFVNNSGSYAAYIYYYSPNGTNRICDYNCYYNGSSSNLIYNYSATLTTSNLNSYSNFDQNSITENVQFVSSTDLHLSDACFTRGANVGLTTDIDGDTRNNPPHIGADEVPTASTDAGVAEILSPMGTVSSGSQTVVVAVKNFGINNLSSVKVHYQVGSGSVVSQSFTLGTSLSTCELDTLTFTSTFSHTSGCNNIRVWTSDPNGSTDGVALNDTANSDFGIPMSGTYTVGGTSPDFTDMDAAFDGLNCAGISGPVVFDVRSGTYTLNRVVSNVSGMTSTDTVLFRSASGNSTMPVCQYDANDANDNFVLQFSDASYWTFDGLHLLSKDGTYGRVVDFINSNTYIRFSNCKLEAPSASTSSSYMAVVNDNSGSTNQSHYITFDGNTILNGSSGLYLYGYSTGSNSQHDWIITNNQIQDFAYYGAYLYYMNQLNFSGNTITTSNTYTSSPYGMIVYYSYGNNRFNANRIIGMTGGYGIYQYYCYGNSSEPDYFTNNFIQIGSGSNSCRGIYSNYSGYQKYYHNSVNVTSTYNSSSYCAGYFYYSSSSYPGSELKNNIFANTGGGYALYVYGPAYMSSDYNCIYSTSSGSYIYSATNGSFSTVSAFTSSTGLDANSIDDNPKFFGTDDLHCISGALDSAGDYVSAVTMDIDGDSRRNPYPSIGADEYTAIDDDAGIALLSSPTVLCTSNTVTVNLRNYGEATLTSATINWSVNGSAQTPYSFTGSVASGGNTNVTIGSFTGSSSASTIMVWTSGPNGKTDLRTSNDTLSQMLNPGMSGNYTVGGSSPDFTSLSDAISAAESNGICGSVNFLVRQGTYTEQVNINPIPGADPSNTLTIKPDPSNTAGVTFQHAIAGFSDNYVLQFNGCSFVTVDSIDFENIGSNSTYTSVIMTRSNGTNLVHDIAVRNCNLTALTTSTTSNYAAVVQLYAYITSYNTLENVQIENNTIQGGSYGVYNYGYSGDPHKNVTISGNTILNPYYMGIYNYYSDTATVENNRIEHTGGYTSYNYGIYGYYSDVLECSGNMIYMSGTASYNYGLYFNYCDGGVNASNNTVDVRNGTTYNYAFYLYYCDGTTTGHNSVVNNMFSVSDPSTSVYQLAAYIYNSSYTDVWHNNFSIAGGPGLSTGGMGLYAYYTSTTYAPIDIRNNIFNTDATNTVGFYANGIVTTSGAFMVDYNVFNTDYFGTSATGVTGSLSSYQSSTGWGTNSLQLDPMFDSLSNLHVNNIALYGTGTNLGITDDIDGDSRGTTPTIGAHEIDPDIEVVSVSLGHQQC